MMVKPSVTELLTKADNRYELVIATSRRARQIVQQRLDEKNTTGGNDSSSNKSKKEESAVTEAATEIAEGTVNIIKDDEEEQK